MEMLALAIWDDSTHLPLKSARLMFLMSPLTTAGPEKAGAGFWICKYEVLDQYDWSVPHTIQIVRGKELHPLAPSQLRFSHSDKQPQKTTGRRTVIVILPPRTLPLKPGNRQCVHRATPLEFHRTHGAKNMPGTPSLRTVLPCTDFASDAMPTSTANAHENLSTSEEEGLAT
jgi:hypothetical protein